MTLNWTNGKQRRGTDSFGGKTSAFYLVAVMCFLNLVFFFLFSTAVIDHLAAQLKVGTPTLQHIIDGLRQPSDQDIRNSEFGVISTITTTFDAIYYLTTTASSFFAHGAAA